MLLNEEMRQILHSLYMHFPDTAERLVLDENYGIPDIVKAIMSNVVDEYLIAENFKENNFIHITYDDVANKLRKKYKPYIYFDEFIIHIKTEDSKDKFQGKCLYRVLPNNFNSENGHLKKLYIVGNIIIPASKDRRKYLYYISSLITHELIHSYEDCERYINGKESLEDNVRKYGYFDNQSFFDKITHIDKQKLSYIIYYLTPAEVRAYTAQIVKDISFVNCYNSKDVFNALNNNSKWRDYLTIEGYIKDIVLGNISCSKSDIEKWWYEIIEKKWKYSDICKYLNNAMKKTKKHMIRQITYNTLVEGLINKEWVLLVDIINDSPLIVEDE